MKKQKKTNFVSRDLVVAVLCLVIGFLAGYYYCQQFVSAQSDSEHVFATGDFNIHFLELGNKYAGDSIYINYGDVDILIDAGSRNSSAKTISSYIDNYTTDGVLEYVIATHAHQDHISAFYSSAGYVGIFEKYQIGTIIDFPRTNSTTVTYNNYVNARTEAVSRGAMHYTALQCYREEAGAQRIYRLGDDVEMEILYNYYYENYTSNENNYSVCVMFRYGGERFLFTADLESEGEDRLVDYYSFHYGGLGQCKLFKAGHHGSSTATQAKLLAAIQPEYVVFTCAADTQEYNFSNTSKRFPAQEVIDRVAPYTDKVFVTTLITDYSGGKFRSFNGDILFSADGDSFFVEGSSNNTKLKDSDWFKSNRTTPAAWMAI